LQFVSAIRPDRVWYLPAMHHVQLIKPDPVWNLQGKHHEQLIAAIRPAHGKNMQ
jgi:hypothetical protein